MRLNKFFRASALVVAVSVTATAAFANKVDFQIQVTFKPGTNSQVAAQALASGKGKIVRKVNDNTYVIALNNTQTAPQTIDSFLTRKSVANIEPLLPVLPETKLKTLPVSQLRQAVDTYKAAYLTYKELTPSDEDENEGDEVDEIPGLDFLEAYLQYKELRSYPNDEIDLSGYREIARRRAAINYADPLNLNRETRNPGGFPGSLPGIQTQGVGVPLNNWEFVGPTNLSRPYRIYYGLSPMNGRVNAVAIHPTDPNTFYIGGAQGGVWKSTDAGTNWTPLSDDWPLLGVSSIEIHPTNPNILLAGTGDFYGFDVTGIGIMRSTDGGTTWTPATGIINSASISDIKFNPDNPNIVIASTGRTATGYIYRSTNAGQTWSRVNSNISSNYADASVSGNDGTGRTVWVTGSASNRIYRSDNFGSTWTNVAPPFSGSAGYMQVAASPTNRNVAYLLVQGQNSLYKTTNRGASWTDITNNFPTGYNWSQDWYDYYLTVSTITIGGVPRDFVVCGLIDVVTSIDGGANWRNSGGANFTATYSGSAITHNDQHSVTVDPQNPNRFLIGNDGGAYLMTYDPANDEISWDRLSRNLGITQFYTIAAHPTNPDYLKGGTQDNATPHSFGNLADWGNPGAGDGAGTAINQANPNIQYNSFQFQGIRKTLNGYGSQTTITPSWSGHSTPFIGGLWLDPNNNRYLYANTNYLNRYDENTDTWDLQLSGNTLGSRVNAVAIAPGDSNKILAGSTNGELHYSTNFGNTFNRIDRKSQSNGLPNRSITTISVNPNNIADVLVGYSGSGAGHLYRCTNINAATPIWVNVSGPNGNNLPNLSLNDVARDLYEPVNTWYAATDVGVFMTDNGGITWEDITQARGLPNVQVNKLVAVPGTGYLNAATFGRGMWRIKLVPAIVTGVSVSPSPVWEGDTALLTISLDRVAPTGGLTIDLSSSNSSVLSVPANATIAAGQNSIQVPVTAGDVSSDTDATVTVTSNGQNTSVTVQVLRAVDAAPVRNLLRNGNNVSGGIAEMAASDNNDYQFDIQQPNFRLVQSKLNGRLLGITNPSTLRTEIELATSIAGLEVTVYHRDTSTGDLVPVHTTTSNTTDTLITFDLNNASDYIDANRTVIMVVQVNDPQRRNYTVNIDQVRWRAR